MKRIFIIGHGQKPGVESAIERFLPWLRERADVCGVHLGLEESVTCPPCDMVMAFGGDGTILSAARALAGCDAPVLGINLGRVGFLAEVPVARFHELMPRFLDGGGHVRSCLMLECLVRNAEGEERGPFVALNDVVLLRDVHAHTIDFQIHIDSQTVSEYSGDGLIVSTPTGSTGYNLSAGGPLVAPDVRALALTPICPFSLTNRPLIVKADERLSIRMPNLPDRSLTAVLSADGQIHEKLECGGEVDVYASERSFRMLTLGRNEYFRLLHDKLHWGRSVKRED
jgi:NAD+ kinase